MNPNSDPPPDPGSTADADAAAAAPRATVRRRLVLAWAAAGVGGAALAASARLPLSQARVFPPLAAPLRFELDIDPRAAGVPVNRNVLGSNVQWVDGGDDLLGADDRFDPAMLALARELAPTVLRYPGGAQSDAYHWERGVGPMASRGWNEHVNARSRQLTRLGTREFLELCEATGAAPLLTLNLATGTPEEAARWMHATNVARFTSTLTGRPLPRVAYWELGNEPYLTQERPDLALPPAEIADRANRFIRALRAIEPAAVIGLPLTMDRRNGVPTTHVFGYTQQVLARLTERIDFVSVHDAYMPFGGKGDDPAALYWGAMAATRTVQADLAAMQATLRALRPGAHLPLAVTEYNAMFTLAGADTDRLVASPAGGLYVADALRLFASSPDVLLANQWSLSGNWYWGAIHSRRFPRPAYVAMQWMSAALHGERVTPLGMRADTLATPSVGLAAPVAALPLVEAFVTRERTGAGETWRLAFIQKDPRRGATGRVSFAGLARTAGATRDAGESGAAVADVASARLETWRCDDVFDDADDHALWQHADQALAPAATFDLHLPPASLALVTITLSKKTG